MRNLKGQYCTYSEMRSRVVNELKAKKVESENGLFAYKCLVVLVAVGCFVSVL